MKNPTKLLVQAISAALFACSTLPLIADETDTDTQNSIADTSEDRVTVLEQDDAESSEGVLEEILITGTRAQGRTAADSPVAVDSFNVDDIAGQPVGDMTETLRSMIPSFTATPLTGDGSAFIRPTSLRGLPPDDTLVLINSKRRHRSALIAQFGAAMNSGSHSTDVGHIPGIALKSVEVLRDGAAAQYGSDAIAGVINFILKDADHGGSFDVQYGQYFEGERSYKAAGNIGMPLTDDGFFNFSFEWTDNEQLIRGTQRPNAQALIDAGVPLVGTDSPYDGDTFVQTWGRPENDGVRLVFNAGIDLDGGHEFYAFGNYSETYGNYRFFYRDPGNSALQPMPFDPNDPSAGNFCWCNNLPGGFTPYFTGEQTDSSLAFGFRGEMSDGTFYDVSGSWGANDIDYTLWNSLNSSLGPNSPRNFDTGDLLEEDFTLNVDFSKQISDNTNLAWGFEGRQENYNIRPGQPESYVAGPWAFISGIVNPDTGSFYSQPNIGASGRSGFTPAASGRFTRDNMAAYMDVEKDLSDDTLIQFAARFENFSDFGTTFDGKFAFRHDVSDTFTVRGAVSTGFRAPTPGQSNVTSIVTTFDGATGAQTQQGTVTPNDPLALSLGGAPLEPEESTNYSLGFTANPTDEWTISMDLYQIDVDDRINKTQDIPIDNPLFSRLSFYTNALNTKTKGFDIVAEFAKEWPSGANTDFTFAWNHNKTDVVSQNQVNGVDPVSATFITNVENNLPEDRFSFTARHFSGDFITTVRANHYGSHLDERSPFLKVGAETLVDISVNYTVNDNYDVTLGAHNAFDVYPNEVPARQSQGLPYPRRTPIGYDGGMWYLKGTYTFD